jgi:hypothetical protein
MPMRRRRRSEIILEAGSADAFRFDLSYTSRMLKIDKINKIARDTAAANFSSSAVSRVFTEGTTDSEGREALRITIVINPDSVGKLTGDAVLDTLVGIHDRLREAGEERFPIVGYSTEEELQESGD